MVRDQKTWTQLESIVGKRPIFHTSSVGGGEDSGSVCRIRRNGVCAGNAISTKSIRGVPNGRLRDSMTRALQNAVEKRESHSQVRSVSIKRPVPIPNQVDYVKVLRITKGLLTDEHHHIRILLVAPPHILLRIAGAKEGIDPYADFSNTLTVHKGMFTTKWIWKAIST